MEEKMYLVHKVKQSTYNVNNHRWYYRWVYTYSVYEYKTIKLLKGLVTYSDWFL